MKKKFSVVLAIVLIFVWIGISTAADDSILSEENQAELKSRMNTPITDIDEDISISGSFNIIVKDKGDRVYYTIISPMVVGKGMEPKSAVKIMMASGLRHAAKKDPYFSVVAVENGQAHYSALNYAQKEGIPMIEHHWGLAEAADGTVGCLGLDPNNDWVVYDKKLIGGYKTISGDRADMEKLAIGTIMYPDKPSISLKSLGKGKLKQGKHPELAE